MYLLLIIYLCAGIALLCLHRKLARYVYNLQMRRLHANNQQAADPTAVAEFARTGEGKLRRVFATAAVIIIAGAVILWLRIS